jgi:hypothetical protein
VSLRGEWTAALLGCGEDATLSHSSAAGLWGLVRSRRGPVDVTVTSGRKRPGIVVHQGGIAPEERSTVDGIAVTSVARTLLDYAEVVDESRLERAFEEADRLGIRDLKMLEDVCSRGFGRRGLRPIRRLIETAQLPEPARSFLEASFLRFCREHGLPSPETNATVLGNEVDALWPRRRLIVEIDGWSFHRHRAAFERDRARDAAMQAAGYRVVRVTHRRLEREPAAIATELRQLLKP